MMVLVRMALVVLAVACVCPGAGAQTPGPLRVQMPRQGAPMPPRDTNPRQVEAPLVGTARLSGRVVAAETGEPLRRATVVAQATRPPQLQSGGVFVAPRQYSARTDDDGRFVIRQVVAGEYYVSAQRAGFAPQGYGQTRARTPTRRVSVADGADIGSLDFSLTRAGVITGRVFDDEGAPAERVSVRLLRQQRVGGAVRYVPAGQNVSTDDLGQYRLFGLWPGEYILVADKGERGMFGSSPMQDVVVDTVPTYAPGTVNPSEADRITVTAGSETSVDVRMVAATVASVTGRVVTSTGEPFAGALVRLQPAANIYISTDGPNARTDIDGRFEMSSVPPGDYMLTAQSMMRVDGDAGRAEGALLSVTVDDSNVALSVRTTAGATGRGRLVIEGGDVADLGGRELRVSPMSVVPGAMLMMMGPPSTGLVRQDLSFEVTGLRGRQTLSVGFMPEGWWLKDVRYDGQSILDGYPFPDEGVLTGMEMVVSARPTGITGTVATPSGVAASDSAVVVFPEDEDRWERPGWLQMLGRAVRADPDGSFKLANLRPGSYYVLALPADETDIAEMSDPEHLRLLAGRARTVTVEDGALERVTLTLVAR